MRDEYVLLCFGRELLTSPFTLTSRLDKLSDIGIGFEIIFDIYTRVHALEVEVSAFAMLLTNVTWTSIFDCICMNCISDSVVQESGKGPRILHRRTRLGGGGVGTTNKSVIGSVGG
jgi:hypothetical protein